MRRDGLERMIDADGNRAREGLRVLEDLARFVLDAGDLASGLKDLRHGVTATLASLPLAGLAARDTEGDVGGSIGTAAEYERPGIAAIAEAAGSRTAEALRMAPRIGAGLPCSKPALSSAATSMLRPAAAASKACEVHFPGAVR